MAEKNLSAPARSRSGGSAAGVRHVKFRHTERFTVVGNHLAQHPAMSLTAIGLATHIQSLPDGVRIGIKELAMRFAEGEVRIAAALRELVAHRYLARIRERAEGGRFVTRTVFYDNPGAVLRAAYADADLAGEPEPTSTAQAEERAPASDPLPVAAAAAGADPDPVPGFVDVPRTIVSSAAPSARLALPVPKSELTSEIRGAATDLLAGLRAADPRLRLARWDVHRLVPAVAAWLERDLSVTDVRRAILERLPVEGIAYPAGFVGHRLAALLPLHLPKPPPGRSLYPATAFVPAPLRTCDGCERAFRSPEADDRCHDCRTAAAEVSGGPRLLPALTA
ncbi:helix-turn-helix domain-containing protein [Streptomyces hypolithicus]